MKVSCGKGTYIRSLCRDIGDKLGCGGIMDQLVRGSVNATETGKVFTAEDALRLDVIEEKVKNDTISEFILPIDSLFPNYEKCKVTEEGHKKLMNGNILKARDFSNMCPSQEEGKLCLVYDKDDNFTATYEYKKNMNGWKADKMFL